MDIKILKGLLGCYEVYVNDKLVVEVSPWKNMIVTINGKIDLNVEDIVSIHIKKIV